MEGLINILSHFDPIDENLKADLDEAMQEKPEMEVLQERINQRLKEIKDTDYLKLLSDMYSDAFDVHHSLSLDEKSDLVNIIARCIKLYLAK